MLGFGEDVIMENCMPNTHLGTQDNPLSDASRTRLTFKDTLMGKDNNHEDTTIHPDEEGSISDNEDGGEQIEEEGYPQIKLSREEKARLRRPLRQTLIAKVLGRTIGYNYLFRRINSLWKPKAKIEMVAMENDYYIVKFASIDDYEFAKYEGPWMIMDHYLITKEWSPNFNPLADNTEKLLAWVRFPCLPIEYYDQEFLMKVGSKIGRPIKVDQATSLISRGKFARLCVEVDITKPLLAKFKIRRRVIRIEYEGLHLICFHCGIHGHHKEQCSSIKVDGKHGALPEEGKDHSDDQNREEPNLAEIKEKFGPWMMVTRNIRKFERGKDKSFSKFGNNERRKERVWMEIFFKKINLDMNLEDNTDMGLHMDGPDISHEGTSNHRTLDGKGRRPNVQVNYKELRTRGNEGVHPMEMEKQTQFRDKNREKINDRYKSRQAAAAEEQTIQS